MLHAAETPFLAGKFYMVLLSYLFPYNIKRGDSEMFSSENRQLLFELLYQYYILNRSEEKLMAVIKALREELKIIEAADIMALNPKDFDKELFEDWQKYISYRSSTGNAG